MIAFYLPDWISQVKELPREGFPEAATLVCTDPPTRRAARARPLPEAATWRSFLIVFIFRNKFQCYRLKA